MEMHLPSTPLPLTPAERRRRLIQHIATLDDALYLVQARRVDAIVAAESNAATRSAALRPVYRRLLRRDAYAAANLPLHESEQTHAHSH